MRRVTAVVYGRVDNFRTERCGYRNTMTHEERQAFLAERRTMIGGSDAAAVLNIGYGCRRRLIYQKWGVTPDFDLDSPEMERGRAMESIIADKYQQVTGRDVTAVGTQRHTDYEFLGVHMDRLVRDQQRSDPGYLEIKCLGRESFHKTRREGLIEDYILQMQHGLMVTGFQWGSFAIFWPDGWKLEYFDVDRDEEIIEVLREEEIQLWKLIESKDPESSLPERLPPSDKRCSGCDYLSGCQGAALLSLIEEDVVFESDPGLAGLAAEYLEAAEIETEATLHKKSIAEKLTEAMGDRQAVTTNGARITFKAYPRKAYSVKETQIRPLRVYPA